MIKHIDNEVGLTAECLVLGIFIPEYRNEYCNNVNVIVEELKFVINL